MRRTGLGAALALGLAAAALATATDTLRGETVRLNPADQASARAATLKRDLVPPGGPPWRRVRAEPLTSSAIDCPSGADLSKFVVTGVARTRWLGSSIEVDSQTDVYESSWMLRAEWRMRMSRPRALDCIRRNLASTLTRHGDR